MTLADLPLLWRVLLVALMAELERRGDPNMDREAFLDVRPGQTDRIEARLGLSGLAQQRLVDEAVIDGVTVVGVSPLGADLLYTWRMAGETSATHPDGGEWLPRRVDTKSEEVQAAIQAVEAVIERLRGMNDTAALDPARKQAAIRSLELGLDVLRHGQASDDQVSAMLIRPLRWLLKQGATEGIWDMVKLAIATLLAHSCGGPG